MPEHLERRQLLTAAGAAVGGVALAPWFAGSASAASATVPTFVLDAVSCSPAGCGTCVACANHAANKLFTSAAAAETRRAHPGCNCVVAAGPALSRTVFEQLFIGVDNVDRRNPRAAQLLAANSERRAAPIADGPIGVALLTAAGAIGWCLASRNRGARVEPVRVEPLRPEVPRPPR
jgi:hypothetical protein